MSEKRRHSVDIPLSKTLVAMRRVRSLRDPTTNSMSKFSLSVQSHQVETNSPTGIQLGAERGSGVPVGSSDRSRTERLGSDSECNHPHSVHKLSKSKLKSDKKYGAVGIVAEDLMNANQIDKLISRLSLDGKLGMDLEEQDGVGRRNREMDLICIPDPFNCLKEDMESCSEHNDLRLELLEGGDVEKREKVREYVKAMKSSRVVDEAVRSCVGSPSLTLSDARMDASSISTSIFAEEEMEFMGANHRGCGISCCWSITPKFRSSHQPAELEENHPLLLAEEKENKNSERMCFRRDLALYSDIPRSLCDKFRPRSFDELVGQDVVMQSLLNAILKGKVASLYLFHGQRGTGKTSTSRIFAAAVNCLSQRHERPCGRCRQCLLFFTGRDRDSKEVDAAKMNRTSRIKAVLRNAAIPPISSRFKVFIIDECQLLRAEVWDAFLNALDEFPRHVVFVLITDDLDKIPRSAVSRCQKYHFPRVKDVDTVTKLEKICVEEGLEFDKAALEFIASKSNGSVRDAEMMLDQLSLLGERITVSLVYELNGIVSDEELLDLLDLAFSSDTSNTVRRARELMRSRVDPMQLISQMANLVMDILAGRCHAGTSSAGRKFLGNHISETDMQKLRHALKVLSETEKQLKMSKSQTTWLTAALLQFNAGDSSLSDGSDLRACFKASYQQDDGFCRTSKMENVECSASHIHNLCRFQHSTMSSDTVRKLEMIWSRAVEKCQPKKLQKFLRKEAKLSALCMNQDAAVVELDFRRGDHASRAEKSWKTVASAFQVVLDCNVEIRINLVPSPPAARGIKKLSFNLLSCSCGMPENSGCTSIDGDEHSRGSARPSCAIEKVQDVEDLVAIRDREGNTLSTIATSAFRRVQDLSNASELEASKTSVKKGPDSADCSLGFQELEAQPSCFSKSHLLKKILDSSEVACNICLRIKPENFEPEVPEMISHETYFCKNDPDIRSTSSNTQITSSIFSADEDRSTRDPNQDPMVHCWRAPNSPVSKRRQRRRSQLVGWVLPCSTTEEFSA